MTRRELLILDYRREVEASARRRFEDLERLAELGDVPAADVEAARLEMLRAKLLLDLAELRIERN